MGYFLPFYPPPPPPHPPLTARKTIFFKKMKKTPGDNIILHKCTRNHDNMLHCLLYMARDTCNFYFSFWDFFALICPASQKNQKNEKNTWRYHHFTHVYQKLWLDDMKVTVGLVLVCQTNIYITAIIKIICSERLWITAKQLTCYIVTLKIRCKTPGFVSIS